LTHHPSLHMSPHIPWCIHPYFSVCLYNNIQIYLHEYKYTYMYSNLEKHYFALKYGNIHASDLNFVTETQKYPLSQLLYLYFSGDLIFLSVTTSSISVQSFLLRIYCY
jgi:hypothetical protein